MASGGAGYMMTKSIKENLGKAPPERCPKCGGTQFELVEDGIQCLYDGWMHYLTDEQIKELRRECAYGGRVGGLTK